MRGQGGEPVDDVAKNEGEDAPAVQDTRLFATPAGIKLGTVDAIADGAARSFVLQMRAGRFHGFVVRRGGAAFGYVDRCPHMGLPLAQVLDGYVVGERIVCSWHGAIFAVEDGICLGGPCTGARLTPWPVTVVEGVLVTG